MGAVAPLRQLAYSLLAFISWLATSLMLGRRKLHGARFARLYELDGLAGAPPAAPHLLLGVTHFGQTLAVKPTRTRRELGNLLVVAPTRGGKGLLAVSQLLSWPASVVVNDIKGELFAQTAGYRATLGPVFVIDPTGVGHAKTTEDELFGRGFPPPQGR